VAQDRGMAAAFNRMSLYPLCTRRYWKDVFDDVKEEQRRLILRENLSVLKKVAASDAARL
jgi:mRNA deadenylase 3'-5' endonuclease subunit Ccr4